MHITLFVMKILFYIFILKVCAEIHDTGIHIKMYLIYLFKMLFINFQKTVSDSVPHASHASIYM